MFIDEVKITVVSGKWGDGLISWRREKYIPKWGPWGWDGWKWGDVYIQTDPNFNTLSEYRHKKLLRAENGEKWWTNTCHWANAEDLIIKVPTGTIITDTDTNEIIWDLDTDYTKMLVARWGRGGFWNAHFCSSTRQAPWFAELWDLTETKNLKLELKLVADIGIIGIPSAGKSTLIGNITNVSPKIGDYPFTTLTPNLGVLDHKWKSLVLEDVPGLIPGASEWKWLGIEFLKHIERTGVLLHLLDMYRLDQVFSDYTDIRKELEHFSDELWQKEEIIVFSKADLLDDEMKQHILWEFKNQYPDKTLCVISAVTGEWITELIDMLIDSYAKEPTIEAPHEETEIKIYDLKDQVDPKRVKIMYLWDLSFSASGERINQVVRMTDFENREAVLRVYDVLEKMWIAKQLEKKLDQVLEEENRDNSFFFEWNEEETVNPKVIIAGKEIPLDRLKYNL